MSLLKKIKGVFVEAPKTRSLDHILDSYEEPKLELEAQHFPSYSEMAESLNKHFRKMQMGPQNPDDMDPETYARQKKALIESSRLYVPPKPGLQSNDWDND